MLPAIAVATFGYTSEQQQWQDSRCGWANASYSSRKEESEIRDVSPEAAYEPVGRGVATTKAKHMENCGRSVPWARNDVSFVGQLNWPPRD